MKDIVIEKLEKLELHDKEIKKININIHAKEVEIVYEKWDEKLNDYETLYLIFCGVTKMETSEAFSNNLNVEEISEVNCKQVNNDEYLAEIIMLASFGDPDWAIYITFKDIKTKP
ncbi:MAG: hypothetical protein PVH88_11400 [Ignavibacteria bacterium]|jgi:hypothetical protein